VTLRHVILDQVLPRVRSLRGGLVLHAAAVASPLGAYLFLGESGWGKSTLCASLTGQGLEPLADDCILVRRNAAGDVVAVPAYPGLRLSPEALRRVYGLAEAGSPVAHSTDKRRVMPRIRKVGFPAGEWKVNRVYLLGPPDAPAPAAGVRVGRVARCDLATALIANSFQLDVTDRDRIAGVFDEAVGLAEVLQARRLSYPRRFDLLSVVRETLMSDLRSA
jgi:hypothetical protein